MNSIRSGGGSGLRVGSGIGGPLLRSYFAAAAWQFPSSCGGCPSALLEDALEDVFGAPCSGSGEFVPRPGLTEAPKPRTHTHTHTRCGVFLRRSRHRASLDVVSNPRHMAQL